MDSKVSSEKRFALLIDADNVSSKYIKPMMDELSKYGTVTYKRIYGDWTSTLHAKWKDALLENSITPIQQFSYTQGKNATDSAMIIDAMDILYTRSVEGFCIVSSDSDFTRLASRIRESGLTVIGMGEKKTPVPFRKACDIFTTLEVIYGSERGNGSTTPKAEIEQAVVNIITDNQNNGKTTGLGEVGSRLLKQYPDFDVRSYGTNLLSKLLGEFESVQIRKLGSNVAVELSDSSQTSPKDSPADKPAAEKTERPRRRRRSKIATTDADGARTAAESAQDLPQEPSQDSLQKTSDAPEQEPSTDAAHAASAPADAAPETPSDKSAPERPADDSAQHNAPFKPDGASSAPNADATNAEAVDAAGKAAEAETQPAPSSAAQTEAADKPRRTRRRRPAKTVSTADAAHVSPEPDQAPEAKPDAEGGVTEEAPSDKAEHPTDGGNTAPAAKRKPRRTSRSKSADGAAEKPHEELPAEESAQNPAPAEPRDTTAIPTDDIRAYIIKALREAGSEGINLSTLGKRVRAKYRSFKLKDLGYSQFKNYIVDLGDIEVEKRGKDTFAVLAQ